MDTTLEEEVLPEAGEQQGVEDLIPAFHAYLSDAGQVSYGEPVRYRAVIFGNEETGFQYEVMVNGAQMGVITQITSGRDRIEYTGRLPYHEKVPGVEITRNPVLLPIQMSYVDEQRIDGWEEVPFP